MALIEKLTNIADAIREKTGGTEKLSLDGMAEAIAGISAGGGDEQSVLDSFIEGSLTEITSNVTMITKDAFSGQKNITSVNFPLVTKIGENAFQQCTGLTSVNIPLATWVSGSVFYQCTGLTSVNFPSVTFLASAAFQSCENLESASFPSLTQAGTNVFQNCFNLTSVNLPLLTEVSQNLFASCRNIEIIDLPSVTVLSNYSFQNCYKLEAVVLRNDTICSLRNSNAFSKCFHFDGTVNTTYNPEGLKDGYIYVPRALLSDDDATKDYRRATNWSTLATQFRALEDYTVDGTTTGALDLTKI